MTQTTQFAIGQIITHKLYGYTGVIVDADVQFAQTDDWYNMMVRGNPAKAQPWFYVLVDGTAFKTYVAEEFLEAANQEQVIEHPDLDKYVDQQQASYNNKATVN